MFDKELQFFIRNQADLVKKHNGKVLVLRGEEVADVEDTVLDAYLKAKEKYPPGTFMIQPCVPGPEAYTLTLSHA